MLHSLVYFQQAKKGVWGGERQSRKAIKVTENNDLHLKTNALLTDSRYYETD